MAATKESWEIELGNAATVVDLVRYEGTEVGAQRAARRHWRARPESVDVLVLRRPGCRPTLLIREEETTGAAAAVDERRELLKLHVLYERREAEDKVATWVGRNGTWFFEVETKSGRATAGGYRSRSEALATAGMAARVLEPLAQAHAPAASQEVDHNADHNA